MLGIVGLFAGHIEVSLRAWPMLDTGGSDDPLVEAALGYMYLMAGRPALAYPRLRSASEAYPDVGFVHTFVADAAVGVGDYDRAERILDEAERMQRLDTTRGHVRVRLDLLVATDRLDEAFVLWEREARLVGRVQGNPLAVQRMAEALERRGESARAVLIAAGFPGPGDDWRNTRRAMVEGRLPSFFSYERFVFDLCTRWWNGSHTGERHEFVNAAGDDASHERFILERFALARHRLATWPPCPPLALPGAHAGTLEIDLDETWDPGAPPEALPLAGVCALLGIDGATIEP